MNEVFILGAGLGFSCGLTGVLGGVLWADWMPGDPE
jgi:hypothetical protein